MSVRFTSSSSRLRRRSLTLARSLIIFQNCFREIFRCSRTIKAVKIGGDSKLPLVSRAVLPLCHMKANSSVRAFKAQDLFFLFLPIPFGQMVSSHPLPGPEFHSKQSV